MRFERDWSDIVIFGADYLSLPLIYEYFDFLRLFLGGRLSK
jgi:hypothetical protein